MKLSVKEGENLMRNSLRNNLLYCPTVVPKKEINLLGGARTYTYDGMNNVISMVDELGNRTVCEYTLTGQLAKVIDALGNETRYTYDLRDQLIEVYH